MMWNEEEKRWDPSHHLFTAPMVEDTLLLESDPGAARGEQLRSVRFIRLLASRGFMGAAKATMQLLGVDVGPARLPNTSLNSEQRDTLRADLDRLGFFDWIKPSP